MSTQTLTAPVQRSTGDADLDHITECHDDDRALCGLDLSGVPFVDELDDDRLCVVCADMEYVHCGCECGCCDDDSVVVVLDETAHWADHRREAS